MTEHEKIEFEEKYLLSSECVPMEIPFSTCESFCNESNIILVDDDFISKLKETIQLRAFNYLVNNDCMLSMEYVYDMLKVLKSKAQYVERSKYDDGKNEWFRWTIREDNNNLIYGLKDEPLGSFINRIGWASSTIKE